MFWYNKDFSGNLSFSLLLKTFNKTSVIVFIEDEDNHNYSLAFLYDNKSIDLEFLC